VFCFIFKGLSACLSWLGLDFEGIFILSIPLCCGFLRSPSGPGSIRPFTQPNLPGLYTGHAQSTRTPILLISTLGHHFIRLPYVCGRIVFFSLPFFPWSVLTKNFPRYVVSSLKTMSLFLFPLRRFHDFPPSSFYFPFRGKNCSYLSSD